MESLHFSSNYSSLFCTTTTPLTTWSASTKPKIRLRIRSSVTPDPWSLRDGNPDRPKPKPKSKHPKNPLSDDNARRIIKSKARYLSVFE